MMRSTTTSNAKAMPPKAAAKSIVAVHKAVHKAEKMDKIFVTSRVKIAYVDDPFNDRSLCWGVVETPYGFPMAVAVSQDHQALVATGFGGKNSLESLTWLGHKIQDAKSQLAHIKRDDRAVSKWKSLLPSAQNPNPDVSVRLAGTPYQKMVWQKLSEVRHGATLSYGALAMATSGCEGFARAIGGAMAANPVCIWIPCHRVLRADGHIGHYSSGGADVKRAILRFEGAIA